jgi:hypothetical protein
MKYPYLMWTSALAVAVGTGAVLAQTTSTTPTPTPTPATDVGPTPAEERSSTGAIVLENSLVRAQRDNAFQRSASETGVTSMGSSVLRATSKAQAEADLAKMREAEAVDLRLRGAGSLIEK